MKAMRWIGAALLALLLAAALAACQKKAEMESTDEQVGMTDQAAEPAPETPAMSEPTPVETPPQTAPAKPKPARKPSSSGSASTKSTSATYADQANTVEVPTGTVIEVSMVTPVDTRTSNVGDRIEAKLLSPIVRDGMTIANQDAMIRGEITALQRASRSKSEEARASVTLTFTSLETVEGEKALHATVTNSEGKLVAKSTSTRDKLIIGGSTVAGAIIGQVAGKDTKSTVIGAVGGAVLGTGAVLASKGHELEVPAGSKVTLRVDEPITIVAK